MTSLVNTFRRTPPAAIILPIVLALLLLALSLGSEYFFTARNLQQVLIQGAVLTIVAVGLTFVIINGDLDLSIGANVALSGVITGVGMTKIAPGNVLLGILLGLGTGLTIGVINGLLTAIVRVPAFVATMGTGVVATGLSLALTNGLAVGGLPPSFQSLATTPILGVSSMVWWAVLVFAFGSIVLHRTTFGARTYAVGGNRQAAFNAGISPASVRFSCLAFAGLLAGLGGVLSSSRVLAAQPGDGMTLTLFATAAVILGGTKLSGGTGNMWLTLFGVLLIAILQNGLSILGVPYAYQQVAVGSVFVIAAITTVFPRRSNE